MAFNKKIPSPKQFQSMFDVLYGSATVNPSTVATGAQSTTSVTVTGVALGDAVVAFPGVDVSALVWSAVVSAANTVKISMVNTSGDHIDVASSTWRFVILRPKGDFGVI